MYGKNIKKSRHNEDAIYTIINPISSNGKTKKRWPENEARFKKAGINLNIHETLYPGHAVQLTNKALIEGNKTIMAVGGDGTVNEVVNGFLKDGKLINKEAVLLVFSQGTGSDYVKTLGLDKKIETVIDTYKRYEKKWVDIGKMNFLNFDCKPVERYFVNEADVGIGGETVEYINKSSKLWGGMLTYFLGAIRTVIKYQNKDMEIRVDNKIIKDGSINSVMVSLGKYFAGGMPIAPRAVIDDGLFDIIILGDLSKTETLLNLYKAYKGTHIDYHKVDYITGQEVEINSNDRVLIDIDGESAGLVPAKFKILKKAFPILV